MKSKIVLSLIAVLAVLFSCNDSEKKSSQKKESESSIVVADSIVIKEGKKIAMSTFKVLSSDLKKAINKGGPIAGIEVCSSKAITLTDSMSKEYNVDIKRTSLKLRNQNNKANSSEKNVLEGWNSSIESGMKIKPEVLHMKNGDIMFIAPIKLKSFCLSCHGNSDMVTPEVKAQIMKHYPLDKAQGYDENDLRGAWSIKFSKDYFKRK
ncbi:MAG: DUF3365 domain-containing protein [Bacteroidota bacterium]